MKNDKSEDPTPPVEGFERFLNHFTRPTHPREQTAPRRIESSKRRYALRGYKGRHLRGYRESLDMSQAEFALYLGVECELLIRWERGELPIPDPVKGAVITCQLI